jgi:ABC-type polysaccharide/polyol phosphate export permease
MMRNILLDGQAPLLSTLVRLAIVSFGMFGMGMFIFAKLKNGFYSRL